MMNKKLVIMLIVGTLLTSSSVIAMSEVKPFKLNDSQIEYVKENHKKTIIIDSGHGYNDVGAVYKDINESDLTKETGIRLKTELEKLGYNVIQVHGIDVMKRVEVSNLNKADLYLSIHYNSAKNPNANGYECAIDYRDMDNYDISKRFIDKFCDKLNLTNRGVMKRKLFTRFVEAPAVLIELGFGSNDKDLEYAKTHQWSITNTLKQIIVDELE